MIGPVTLRRAATLAFVALAAPLSAQQMPGGKKVLTAADYTRWRSISGAQISADGKWVSYVLQFTNVLPADTRPVLHIRNLDADNEVEVANATNATFSPDAKWIVYQVDSIVAGGGRGGRAGGAGGAQSPAAQQGGRGAAAPPPPRKFELRNLATGAVQAWQDVQSAFFSPQSTHLVLRRRGPGAPGGGAGGRGGGGGGGPDFGGAAAPVPNSPRGADVILVDLSTSRAQLIGSVGDIAFNRKGDLLAYTVDATVKDGNGLFVMEMPGGAVHAIDNDTRSYSRLAWSDDGNSIAVLKAVEVPRMRERDNTLLAITDVRGALTIPQVASARLDPKEAAGFPKGFVVSDRAQLAWSEDKSKVFFGIIAQSPAPDTAYRAPGTDSLANVDVWRTDDDRIQSQQMIRANADRNFTFREAFIVAGAKYVTLSDSSMREVELSLDGTWAVGRDVRAYISDYKRPAADFYRVNVATGERTLMFKNQLTGQHVFGITPDGSKYLFWKDDKYQAYDLATGTTKAVGAGAPSFVDTDYDHPGPKPSWGVVGATADGTGVIVEGKYDLWLLPFDNSAAKNLTNGAGAKGEIRYRYVRMDPVDSTASRRVRSGREVDLSKPVMLTAYGEYTKKAGFSELSNGQLRQIIYEDAAFNRPVRAAKADKYLFTRETFAIYPDLRVSGPSFTDAKQVSNANPQQAEYNWGRRILFDFKTKSGIRAQGILAIPDDYKPGEKRPMIVNFYEKNSQNLHRYSAPSYITGMGSSPVEAVSRGYLTMLPDVYFSTGRSHSDMLECVEAATKKVIEMGYADPKKIGVNGHSYGGEGAAFIGTRSKLFAAVGMGAGVTDLYTDFSQSWGWSYQVQGGSGLNGNDYYLYGQGRWGFSPWDKPEVYHYESALTHVPEAVAPFLMMHGTADPTVSFSEGMNFYNAMRYNGKSAVLLAYPNEGHGLSGLANRRDLTVRFFEFFDHYLKGGPAPKWMTDGVPFIVKETAREQRPAPVVVP